MRKAIIFVHDKRAGVLSGDTSGGYRFTYDESYDDEAVSLTMPVTNGEFSFAKFPSFFEGLLPEGIMLEGLLKIGKIDKNDYFSQLIATGNDLVGAVTVKEWKDE
jgi:serine/threonine-protein kinase HipA